MNTQFYFKATKQALFAAILTLVLIVGSFFFFEPNVSQALDGTPFTIKQTISDEISFLVQASNVVASGTINGMTGGTANGSTFAVVKTNKATGYNMTIAFTNNGTNNAMKGDMSGGDDVIMDYPASGSEPTFLFSTASSAAVFAYTVSASSTLDLDPSFKDDGSSCNAGSSDAADRCWMEPQTTPYTIINRTTAADGATTSIAFRVHVPNNPTPSVPAGTYTATATLTALNN